MMQAFISNTKTNFILSEELEDPMETNIPVGEYEPDGDHKESFEVVSKHHGYLHMPGCLDMTSISLGDSIHEVAQDLLNLYYDREPEYMSEHDKGQKTWLETLANPLWVCSDCLQAIINDDYTGCPEELLEDVQSGGR